MNSQTAEILIGRFYLYKMTKNNKKIEKLTNFLRVFFVIVFIAVGFFGFVHFLDKNNPVIAIVWIIFSFVFAAFSFTLIPFIKELIFLGINFKDTAESSLSIQKKAEELNNIKNFK